MIDIEDQAFAGNSFSSYVYIPNENANVDAFAFDSVVSVVQEGTDSCFVRATDDNTVLADYLCLGLTVEIPNNVISIADSVFENKGLISVIFPNGLTSIGSQAFKDNNLESLDIPDSVTDIEDQAFAGNSFSPYVYIPNENANINTSAFDFSVSVVQEGTDSCFVRATDDNSILADYLCLGLTVEIPNNVISIADSVFENKGLNSVIFPNGLTSIGSQAFKNNNLESLDIPDSVIDIEDQAFAGNSFSSYVYIPNENANVNISAFDSTVSVAQEGTDSCFVRATDDNTVLADYLCLSLTVEIPSDVMSIADSVFENKGLTSVSFPHGLTSIGSQAFKNNNLESLDIPDSVIDIEDQAFAGNSFSSYVYIPNENANVNTFAFDSTVSVVQEGTENCFVRAANDNTILADYPCSNPTVEIPSDVISIADRVFENKGLTSVSFPHGLTSIGSQAFKDNNLVSLDIPDSVIDIEDQAFAGNSFSSYVYIPNENANVNISAFDSTVSVAQEGTDSCFVRATNDNTVLADYPCSNSVVEIPNDVISIADHVFENKGLNSVSFPSGLISIGSQAFKDNNLVSLAIPDSVTDIEDQAFAGNSFSSYVYIPNENANVNISAFDSTVSVVQEGTDSCFVRATDDNTVLAGYLCLGLTVEIPNNVISIADSVFENKGLTSVSFPEGLTSIGNQAFKNNNLESLDIPDSVMDIKDQAFAGNSFSSYYVYIPNENANVDAFAFDSTVSVVQEGTQDCFVREIDDNTVLADYPCSNPAVEIPSDVISIADSVFENKGLISVSFPYGLTSIGSQAFKDNNLESLDIPDSVTDIGDYAFMGNIDLGLVHIPHGNPNVGIEAFPSNYVYGESTLLSCYKIQVNNNGTITIKDYYNRENGDSSNPTCPRDVIIPQRVTSIDNDAFKNSNITSVIIPDSVTSIGSAAFSSNSLTSVIIPDSVIIMSNSAFSYNSLTSVIIPDSVTSIGSSVFSNNSLTSVYISENITFINNFAFSNNSLTSVIIPDSVTSIGRSVFYLNSLILVTIPDSVSLIDDFAFKDNNITSVVIGSGITSIKEKAFRGNDSSMTVCIEAQESDVEVDSDAFANAVTITYDSNGDCAD